MKSKSFVIPTIVLALISLASAIQLTLEKIELWKNPNYIPTCSWNPLFSCQGPMNSWQSSVFVLPNPIIGIAGFAILALIAFTALFVKFPKWYWTLWLTGVTAAFGFIIWLITQSLYDIQALCIYCMIVWTCVIPIFWITVSEYIKTYYPNVTWLSYVARAKWALIIASYFTVALMIYLQFSDFFNLLIRTTF